MFYGAVIKPNSNVTLNALSGEVLHLSAACLRNPTNDERTHLILHQKEKSYILCTLKKDLYENIPLDLFIATRDGGYLKVEGKSDIHISGYYEPMISQSDDEELDSESESIQDEDLTKKAKSGMKGKRKGSIEVESDLMSGEENEDMKDDEDDDDDEEKYFDDSDEDDTDDDEEIDEEVMRKAIKEQVQKKTADSKKKQQAPVKQQKQSVQEKKRKASEQMFSKPGKQQKSSVQTTSQTNVFEKAVSDYLKKHGRSLISQVAAVCPKPTSITMKYREFLVGKPSSFEVEGQFVSLKN